jgi:hypothetical protein
MLGYESLTEHPFSTFPDAKPLVEVFVDSAWRITGGSDVSFSYNILNKRDRDFAYRVYSTSMVDMSWIIKDGGSKAFSYKIYNVVEKDSAWRIYRFSDKDYAYKILNGAEVPASYKIFNIKAQDTSWRIGADHPLYGSVCFNMIKQEIEFSKEEITILFNEEDKTLMFIKGSC